MAVDLVGAPDVIKYIIEKGFIVIGSFQAVIAVWDNIRQELTRSKVFKVNCISFRATRIDRISQQLMIGTHLVNAEGTISMTGRQGVLVQQNLFGRLQAALFPAINGIRLSFFGSSVVVIITHSFRNILVRFFDPA